MRLAVVLVLMGYAQAKKRYAAKYVVLIACILFPVTEFFLRMGEIPIQLELDNVIFCARRYYGGASMRNS